MCIWAILKGVIIDMPDFYMTCCSWKVPKFKHSLIIINVYIYDMQQLKY